MSIPARKIARDVRQDADQTLCASQGYEILAVGDGTFSKLMLDHSMFRTVQVSLFCVHAMHFCFCGNPSELPTRRTLSQRKHHRCSNPGMNTRRQKQSHSSQRRNPLHHQLPHKSLHGSQGFYRNGTCPGLQKNAGNGTCPGLCISGRL